MQQYYEWKKQKLEDKDLETELLEIEGNEKEIFDRFRCDLAFGTGGLRGIIGVGTNRMNVYTVARATQGLANYLHMQNKSNSQLSVAIAYDSRIKGLMFSQKAASVLAANNIKVYMYPELMPTPALSFAVRYLKCDAGICVTASHNPAIYNGYKAYGNDGCQIGPLFANIVLSEIGKTDIFKDVKCVDFETALKNKMIQYIGDDVFDAFINSVKNLSLLNGCEIDTDLKIVYTPLNGSGRRCVMAILDMDKRYHVSVVKEQEMPDGNFPTCPYPNPENAQALELALKLSKEVDADIFVATDPDCDRCRVAIKTANGYQALSGNEIGILLLYFIAKRRTELKTMPKDPLAVTTIVSTIMTDEVAKDFNIELLKVLTGFKYIGEIITKLDGEGKEDRFIFGYEESYGYLSGSHVRDKDGVNAVMLLCEMALYYKKLNMTLVDVYDSLCEKYGYFSEDLMNFTFEGADGSKKMLEITKNLRKNPLKYFANHPVTKIVDYHKEGLKEGDFNDITLLPDSDVLEYHIDGGQVLIRPSGTEPKMKVYLTATAKTRAEADAKLLAFKQDISAFGL